jgi:hypothetical protein
MIKINRIFSVYFLVLYYLVLVFILLFIPSVLDVNNRLNIYVEKEIAIFTFSSILIIWQIYSISAIYYLKLADTFSFILFVFVILNPFYDFFYYSYQLWIYSFINFLCIFLLQLEKFYLK